MRPIRRILVATDLSPRSDALVRAGAALAATVGAELHLLYSFELTSAPGESAPATFPERVAQAEQALRDQVERAVPSQVEVASGEVVIYAAHKAILDRAEAVSADLIVLGAHRKRATGDVLLGTTADRVVRTSPVPVLVMRGELRFPLGRVVAPIDLAHPARESLDYAAWWASSLGRSADGGEQTELRILHVVAPGKGGADDDARARVAEELREAAESALERSPAGAAVRVDRDILWEKNPAEEIIRYADETEADLIVMGTHGAGMIGRVLLGSVASVVVRRAPCPVLLVPPALWRDRS